MTDWWEDEETTGAGAHPSRPLSGDRPPLRRPDDRPHQQHAPDERPPQRRLPGGRRPSAAGKVLAAVLLGLGLALFLNAPGLKRSAESLPYGARRTVAVAFAAPIAAVSDFLYLDRPGQWARSALGKGGVAEEKGAEDRLADLGEPTAGATPGVLRHPTRKEPLRAWVGGDSMTQVFGRALVDAMRDTRVMKATIDYRISTGLSRPDYFDWPRHLRYEIDKLRPEVVVIMFGANDGQGVRYEGEVLDFGTPAWIELYRRRVGRAMDLAMNDGYTKVYWIGQPIVRSDEFAGVLATMNEVYAQEAAKRPRLTYIPTWELFADRNGEYADYLRDDGGKIVLMRQEDGVHLSLEGGDRLADHILAIIRRDFGIER